MQTLDLNLATRPFRNNTLLWAGFALALVAIGTLTMWNVQTYLESTRGLADLRQRAGDIESRRADLDRRDQQVLQAINRYDLGPLFVRSEKANEVIRWKAFSWTRLFNLLQEVQPYGVQMATISPVFRSERGSNVGRIDDPDIVPVTVDGIARGLSDFLEFQQDLLADPHFDRVEPVRATTDQNSGETVFQLRFHYDPRVGDEIEDELVADVEAAEPDVESSDVEVATAEPEQTEPLDDGSADEELGGAADDLLQDAEKVAALQLTDTPEAPGAPVEETGGGTEPLPAAPGGSAGAPTVDPEPDAAAAAGQPDDQPEEQQRKKRNPRRRGRKGKNRGTPTPQSGTAEEPDETSDDDAAEEDGSAEDPR